MLETITVTCPYCDAPYELPTPKDYSPRYLTCGECNKRFIMEPTASDYAIYKDGEAPCCSDPECRALEMGAGDD